MGDTVIGKKKLQKTRFKKENKEKNGY